MHNKIMYGAVRIYHQNLIPLILLAFASWCTSFSRVLPTSQVGYHAGNPIASVVYCLYKITFSRTESFSKKCGFSTVIKSYLLSKVIISQSCLTIYSAELSQNSVECQFSRTTDTSTSKHEFLQSLYDNLWKLFYRKSQHIFMRTYNERNCSCFVYYRCRKLNITSNCTQLYFVESIRKNFVLTDGTGSYCNGGLHSLLTSCSAWFKICLLARVVQTLDSTIHRINHYPADKYWRNQLRYSVDSDLSSG